MGRGFDDIGISPGNGIPVATRERVAMMGIPYGGEYRPVRSDI